MQLCDVVLLLSLGAASAACNSIVGLEGEYQRGLTGGAGGSGGGGAGGAAAGSAGGSSPECSGPHEHLHAETGHCYLMLGSEAGSVDDPYAYQDRWIEARGLCIEWGGDLAAVSSGDEHLFLTTFAEEHTWTGGTDVTVEGTFEWVNGEPWWDNWGEGFPRDADEMGDYDCVALGNDALKYEDAACNATRWVLCERGPR